MSKKTGLTNIVPSILTRVGKPFYFILSGLIFGVVFLLYLIGHSIRIAFRLTSLRISLSKLKSKKKRKNRFALPKILTILAVLLAGLYFFILKDLPSPKDLVDRQIQVSTKIYDRNGNLLYKIYKDENRTVVKLEQVPPHVRLATLAAEDAEFYNHPGFSLRGISRAFLQNIKTGKLQGGSTITQQLVKNTLLTPEKTFTRKVKEIILSIATEATFSKDEILEMYMNEVSYGGTAYGIEEASQEYFGKGVKNLNLPEAAFLAGLPQSPTRFSPFGASFDLGFARQKEILKLMRINKYITTEQETEALNQRITFRANKTNIKAPHFVMYIRQLLVDQFGEEQVEKGGLEVITSLDLPTQELAQQVVTDEVNKLKSLHVGNGAALVLNPENGEVLAMVGSKDYFNLAEQGNVNVTLRPRQPGSSIKIVNYAYALGNGYNPATIIDDSPVSFAVPGQPLYSPKNYDGKFKGKIPLRIALAESRNIPAVKILASYGVSKMVDLGQKFGITTWDDRSRFGLSLTLGGGEVKLIELAQVFAGVANYGKKVNLNPILQVKDYEGKTLYQKGEHPEEQIIDPRVAFMLINILKDNIARSGEFGLSSYLNIKNHPEVAVKTGTSNNLRDNLTVGFNQDYLVAVWVGNNDNSPMARVASGITGASPIWNKIMSALLSDKPSVDWRIPDKLVKVNCPNKSLPAQIGEWFFEEDKARTTYCSLKITPDTKENKVKEKVPQIL